MKIYGQTIRTLEEFRGLVSEGQGAIVINDVARNPPRAHRPDCWAVQERFFVQRVIENASRNGTYEWFPSLEDALGAGAVECRCRGPRPRGDRRAPAGNGPPLAANVASTVGGSDVDRVFDAARHLSPAEGVYFEGDFVMNLFETVLDYMQQTPTVVRALKHYRDLRWDEVRTLDDLEALFGRYANDKVGNTAFAVYLWGYKFWTRAEQLRDLAAYFRQIGVTDQERLRAWATESTFERDFKGKVRGLGPAVYQWLVMRQGVDTVKPDVHTRRFAEAAVGRPLGDDEVIGLLTDAASRLGIKAQELDARVWEASRGSALPYPTAPLNLET